MSDRSVFESEKEKEDDFQHIRSAAQSRLFLKESSAVSWSTIVTRVFWGSMFWKHRRHSGQFRRTVDCVTCEISIVQFWVHGHIHKKFWINRWLKTCSLGETKEDGSTTKTTWNEVDACSGLQWSCWGPSWRRISRQRTLHQMGTCWLQWANISVFGVSRVAVSRLTPETNRTGSEIQCTPCPLGSEL